MKEEKERRNNNNEERGIRKKKEEATTTQYGERFGHETGRHGSVRSKNQIDVSPRTLRSSKAVLEVRGEIS